MLLLLVSLLLCLRSSSLAVFSRSRLQRYEGLHQGRVDLRLRDGGKFEEKLKFDEKTNRFFEANTNEEPLSENFFLIDNETGKPILLTKEEKERIFLDSIQSFYFSGTSGLSDDQFDRLRDDLSWEGSPLVTTNRNETLFVNAVMAYNKGKPIITDQEFDDLKLSLKLAESKIAVATKPKCYVDTGVCKVTWGIDNFRSGSLYFPATLIAALAFVGVSFELPFIGEINPLVLLVLGAAPIWFVAKAITENIFFERPLVARGPCPSCGADTKVFFGGVLGVAGEEEQTKIKCTNCKANLTVKRSTLRVSTLV